MRIKLNFLTYNALIYLRTECSEREKRSGPNREASVRQYNDAGMFCPQFYLRAEQVLLIYNAQIY
jgi:hypothetical protein